ncbi:MAG: LLM class flavin-dependent oxidoreductase, partial [Nitrososphaerales archaeon]
PRPLQKPHPPLWMPAESAESIEYAVSKRVPVARGFVPTVEMRDGFNYYRDCAQKIGWSPAPEYFMPLRNVYVAETMEQARRESEKHLAYFYKYLIAATYRAKLGAAAEKQGYRSERSYAYSTQGAGQYSDRGARYMNFDFDTFQKEGDIIVGDAEYVLDEIKHQSKEAGGIGVLMGLFKFGSLPHDLTVKNLKLFSERVMPKLRNV